MVLLILSCFNNDFKCTINNIIQRNARHIEWLHNLDEPKFLMVLPWNILEFYYA